MINLKKILLTTGLGVLAIIAVLLIPAPVVNPAPAMNIISFKPVVIRPVTLAEALSSLPKPKITKQVITKFKPAKKLSRQEQFINKISARIDRLDIKDLPKEIIIAKACLESGYGKVCPGNNLFGMTGRGPAGSIKRKDSDWINGQRVDKWKRFKAYHNRDESIRDLLDWYYDKDWFNELVSNDKNTIDNILWYLDRSTYATDPNYASKLKSIIKRYKL